MLTPARIAVLVSGGGTNLQALLDAQRDGKMPHGEIVLVVSSRAGAYALTRAENAGVAARVLTPSCGQKPFENELSVLLRERRSAYRIGRTPAFDEPQRIGGLPAFEQLLPLAAERVCAEIVREKEQKND